MRYRTYCRLTLTALVALTAACSDTPTASRAPAAAWSAPSLDRAQVSTITIDHDTVWARFEYQPKSGGTYQIGEHGVIFPKRSICDPLTSSYGPTEWDAPCEPARQKIMITAKAWVDSLGHPRVDFSPALRFVPSDNTDNWVVLFLRDRSATFEELAPRLTIFWSPSPEEPAVDESITDPTLQTFTHRQGYVYRRVKHFSGYLVATRTETTEAEEVQ
jgi:hypothetical protein